MDDATTYVALTSEGQVIEIRGEMDEGPPPLVEAYGEGDGDGQGQESQSQVEEKKKLYMVTRDPKNCEMENTLSALGPFDEMEFEIISIAQALDLMARSPTRHIFMDQTCQQSEAADDVRKLKEAIRNELIKHTRKFALRSRERDESPESVASGTSLEGNDGGTDEDEGRSLSAIDEELSEEVAGQSNSNLIYARDENTVGGDLYYDAIGRIRPGVSSPLHGVPRIPMQNTAGPSPGNSGNLEQKWTWDVKANLERRKMLLVKGFFHDFIIVLVGQNGSNAPCQALVHRSVVGSASPVLFYAIAHALKNGTNILELKEHVDIFSLFLEYIYTGHIGPCHPPHENWILLQQFAFKYKVSDLMDLCSRKLMPRNGNIETTFQMLCTNGLMDMPIFPQLVDYVSGNGSIYLSDKRFAILPEAVVIEIIKRDDLACSCEMEVLAAVIRWGQEQCRLINKAPADPRNFGPLLKRLMPYVRFPCTFDEKFWLKCGQTCGLGIRNVIQSKTQFGTYNTTARRFLVPARLSFTRYTHEEESGQLRKNMVRWKPPKSKFESSKPKETLLIKLNLPLVIYGISIIRGAFGEDFKKNKYVYNDVIPEVSITLPNSRDPIKPVANVYCKGDVSNSEFVVFFGTPLQMPQNEWIKFQVSFSGHLLVQDIAKKMVSAQKLPVSKCQYFVGSKFEETFVTTMRPPGTNFLLPVLCDFRRPDSKQDKEKLPLTKGFIDSFLFSFHHPHPEGPLTVDFLSHPIHVAVPQTSWTYKP